MSLLLRLTRSRQLLQYRPMLIRTSGIVPVRLTQTSPKEGNQSSKKDDGIKYTITFKQHKNIKEIFKEVYSLYGPIFIVCHIGVSLTSLGFFCGLSWLLVDPLKFIPESFMSLLGSKAATMTSGGGKFVVAYAIHKLILPARLGTAILLTRFLANKLKIKRKSIDR